MTKPKLPPNPYFQLPQRFDPAHYYGSRTLTDLTLQTTSDTPPRSIELIGLPGMGKSTLLRYLAHPHGALERNKAALQPLFRAEPSLMLMVLVEFRLLPTDTHPYGYLHDKFFSTYRNYLEQGKPTLKNLPELLPAKEPLTPESATSAIEEALTTLKQIGVRAAFLLDDFHLAFVKLTLPETMRLRPWRDRGAFVISTEQRLDKVNAEAAGSPFFQTLPVVPFGGLTTAEARRLVGDPASRAGWPFDSEDIDFTVEQAGTHPHLLIVAGEVLWGLRNSLRLPVAKRLVLSADYPELLLGHFKERFTSTFQMYMEHLEETEKRALKAAFTGEERAEHYPALAYLERLGLVELVPDRGGYRSFSPLFGEFIQAAETFQAHPQQEVVFPGIEGRLFQHLQRDPDKVYSFDELSQSVWGESAADPAGRDLLQRRVQVAVSRLRKRLQKSGLGDVISVRGKGYKLVIP